MEHRQGPPTRVLAPVKKTIYSLIDLREIMLGCNRRYLAHLAALDESLLEAAADLGARPFRTFLGVTLPLSLPGIAAGSLLVLIPAVGEFVIPDLLGGADTLMIGKVLWDEFFNNRDWPLASAVAVAMLVLLVAPIMVFQHYRADAAPRSVH